MTEYKVADGHDVAEESLNLISPQPRAGIIRPTRRSFPARGTPLDEGDFVEFFWKVMPEATYQSLLTQFGLDSARSNEVTVWAKDDTFTYVRKNGLAIRPIIGDGLSRELAYVRDVIILVRNLEDAV